MAALTSLQHRHGMIYLDDSSSGEYPSESGGQPRPPPVSHYRPESVSSASSSRGGGETEDSYEEVYTSEEGEEEIEPEYWDPYRKH